MKYFVGLGNIGREYSNTRHNVGFMVVDEYSKKNNLKFKPGKGKFFFAKTKKMMLFLSNLQHI